MILQHGVHAQNQPEKEAPAPPKKIAQSPTSQFDGRPELAKW
jgi:hypothetical protein